jgi:hypothetical protein
MILVFKEAHKIYQVKASNLEYRCSHRDHSRNLCTPRSRRTLQPLCDHDPSYVMEKISRELLVEPFRMLPCAAIDAFGVARNNPCRYLQLTCAANRRHFSGSNWGNSEENS